LRKGYREFALIGTDLGAYGRDLDSDLVDLLRSLLKCGEGYTIRLRNIQPRFLHRMMPQLMDILASGRITYLSTAAESGSNRILRAMNRGYTVEQYTEAVGIINRDFPHIEIRTQLMVGFPGETEEDFRATLRLLDHVTIDYVEIYEFEARPRTHAEQMRDQVQSHLAKKRALRLLIKSIFSNRQRRRRALRRYRVSQRKGQQQGPAPMVSRIPSTGG
jgi:tRNA A37 methylthiotransferase MiaB